MAESILDGTGSGTKARITPDHRLETSSRMDLRASYVSKDYGESYFYYSDVTPTGPADCICYIKNSSSTKDMYITWVRAWCGTADGLDVYLDQTGTPSGGTDIVPVNLNRKMSNSAVGTFQEGVNITNLSGGLKLDRIRLEAGADAFTEYHGLILGRDNVFSLYTITGTKAMEVTVAFYYE